MPADSSSISKSVATSSIVRAPSRAVDRSVRAIGSLGMMVPGRSYRHTRVCSDTAVKTSGPVAGGTSWISTQYWLESWMPDSRITVGDPSPRHSSHRYLPWAISTFSPLTPSSVDGVGPSSVSGDGVASFDAGVHAVAPMRATNRIAMPTISTRRRWGFSPIVRGSRSRWPRHRSEDPEIVNRVVG